MNSFEQEMDRVVEGFVLQITEIARRAARSALESMFVGGADGVTSDSGPAPKAALPGPAPAPRQARGRGVKRAPEDIEVLGDQFAAFVKANPGLRIEQINKQLGTSTKDLALPIRKLVADGMVVAKGQRRATQYFPGRKAK